VPVGDVVGQSMSSETRARRCGPTGWRRALGCEFGGSASRTLEIGHRFYSYESVPACQELDRSSVVI
jgi:hypothetical protein